MADKDIHGPYEKPPLHGITSPPIDFKSTVN